METKEIIEQIAGQYSEEEILGKIDDAIPEYLDEGWEDEYEDMAEAYEETGRGGAHSQVLHEVIRSFVSEHGLGELGTDTFCDIIDGLKIAWDIQYD